ncbi:hypothetical protein COCNU_14G002380 [Cocos nucifera]|uniref:Uncharacterized protein n=1 Tax=Cocos nucifera TaxID=13894 RepID=A0A8K0IUD5_COCNU|nr:hypothetical protein COCNU_14G002380 [Cocos nucifera]
MKVVFISTSIAIVWCMRYHSLVRRTYDKDQDTFRHYILVGVSFTLALLFHDRFTFREESFDTAIGVLRARYVCSRCSPGSPGSIRSHRRCKAVQPVGWVRGPVEVIQAVRQPSAETLSEKREKPALRKSIWACQLPLGEKWRAEVLPQKRNEVRRKEGSAGKRNGVCREQESGMKFGGSKAELPPKSHHPDEVRCKWGRSLPRAGKRNEVRRQQG